MKESGSHQVVELDGEMLLSFTVTVVTKHHRHSVFKHMRLLSSSSEVRIPES